MTIATRHVPRIGLPMADDDHEQIVVRQDNTTRACSDLKCFSVCSKATGAASGLPVR